ncbi:MAG: PAS domain S-box protein [Deltaproteobacteria bacterium]|nr:PAS domain S-box protein [Deltaproteobacteria bacterium]
MSRFNHILQVIQGFHFYRDSRKPSWWLTGIIITATILAVAVTVFLGKRAFHESRLTALDQFNQQQLILARSTANSIETYFAEVSTSLSSAVKLPSIQNMTPDGIEHLKKMYEGFLPRTSIRYIDENGILRFIYPSNTWRQKLINQNYSHDAFFQHTKQAGGVSISGIICNEQDQRRIRMSIPIYLLGEKKNDNGTFKGVLITSFDLDDISRVFIAPIVSGETGYAWLMNHEGYFVAHHEKEFVGKDAFTIRTEKSPELTFESINQIQRSVLAGHEGIGRYVSGWHRGKTGRIEKLIAYSPARIIDQIWSVSVAAPVSEVDRIIRSAAREALYGFSFVLIILISTGSFLSISAYRWSYSLEREVKKQTKELKEATDYLDNLIRSATAPIVVWNPERTVTIVNRSFEKMSGWMEAEMIGQSMDVLFPDDTRSDSLRKVERTSRGEGDWEAEEIPIQHKDGTIRTVLWNSYNTYAEDGHTVVATFAQGDDITDRKYAEKALRESEEKYRAVVQAQTELICRYTSDWKLTFVNEEYCRYFNKKQEELIGTSFLPLIPEEHRKSVVEEHNTLLNSDIKEVKHEHQVISGTGEIRWQQWTNRAIFDDKNHLIEFQSVGRDITDLKMAEHALEETMKNLSMAQEMVHLGSWSWNIITDEVLWSDETYRLFGFEPKEIDVTLNTYIRTVHPDDLEKVQRDIQAALDNIKPYESEHRIIRTDGEVRIHHTQGEVERDIHGNPLKLAGIVQDITEQKRAEEEKKQLEAQLRHAQKMETMGTLVAGVAHEINNPVNKIIFDIPLLQKIWRDVLPDLKEQAERSPERKYGGLTYEFLRDNLPQLLSDMDLAANRVARTVGNLKDFTRQSSIVDRRPIRINDAVENAVRLIQMTLKTTDIALKIDLGKNIPLIEGDLNSIEQSIMNIMVNAIQAIDNTHGRIEITTGLQEKDRHVFISVSDNGKGIDPSISDKIFNPFVSTKQDEGGIGLGLSITYNIVEAHGGKITFESNESKGTTFLLTFPSIET